MENRRFIRRSPNDLVEVGMIIGPASHSYAIWGDNMNPTLGHIRTTGMIMTHVWSLRPEMAHRFAGKFQGVQVVENIHDMMGKIDGVFIDDINAVSVYPILAKPFLEAGVPTFVNRPYATSLTKGQAMVDMAEKHGTALMSASTWEYSESVGDMRAKAAGMADIKGYVAHNSMSDFYTHGVHGVYYIYAVLKDEIKKGRGKAVSASYITPDWRTPNGIVVYEHESPNGPYYGSLLQIAGADANAYMRIFGTSDGDAEGKIPARPMAFRYNTWNAMQLVIQEMFETGKSPETGEDLMEKLTMFLMAFRSALERGGSPVRREEMINWELPPPTRNLIRDGQPSDAAFSDPYSEEELASIPEQG